LGREIDLLDFTHDCDDFITYSRTGEIALWSLRDRKLKSLVTKLGNHDTPLTMIKMIKGDKIIVGYSKMHNKLILVYLADEKIGIYTKIVYVNCNSIDEDETYGNVTGYRADNTNEYLIVTFDTN
jgi:hypothetical protein